MVSDVHYNAVPALGRLQAPAAIPPLIEWLKDAERF
ncbi:MAG: hypothetical protein HC877_00895 [Thioploca sp.]|nr:hypothetical protein [Thioploca sp.]